MVSITRPDERDTGTAQTPGMRREAGISGALSGSEGLWMGVGRNEPGGASGVHHHGESESGIFVLEGLLRFRWGDALEHVADAGPGDFIFVPPYEIPRRGEPGPRKRGGLPAGADHDGRDRR